MNVVKSFVINHLNSKVHRFDKEYVVVGISIDDNYVVVHDPQTLRTFATLNYDIDEFSKEFPNGY